MGGGDRQGTRAEQLRSASEGPECCSIILERRPNTLIHRRRSHASPRFLISSQHVTLTPRLMRTESRTSATTQPASVPTPVGVSWESSKLPRLCFTWKVRQKRPGQRSAHEFVSAPTPSLAGTQAGEQPASRRRAPAAPPERPHEPHIPVKGAGVRTEKPLPSNSADELMKRFWSPRCVTCFYKATVGGATMTPLSERRSKRRGRGGG